MYPTSTSTPYFSDKVFCRHWSISAFLHYLVTPKVEPYNIATPLPRKVHSSTFKVTNHSRRLGTKSSFSTLSNFTELLYRNLVSWAGSVGLEPTTPRLTAECSADWATSQYIRTTYKEECSPSPTFVCFFKEKTWRLDGKLLYKKTLQFTSTTPCVPYSRDSNLLSRLCTWGAVVSPSRLGDWVLPAYALIYLHRFNK